MLTIFLVLNSLTPPMILMRPKYDVLVGSIPTQRTRSTGFRLSCLFRTHNTGRLEFLTVRTKVSAGIAPSYVPSFRKPVPRHGKLVINLQVIRWCHVGITPHVKILVQD